MTRNRGRATEQATARTARTVIRVRHPASRLRSLALPFAVFENGRPALDLTEAVAIPHELRPDPELRLDAQRRLEQQRRLGRDALLAAQDPAHLRHGNAHPLRERGLREATGLDEFLAQDLTGALGRLGRRDANGEDHADGIEGVSATSLW